MAGARPRSPGGGRGVALAVLTLVIALVPLAAADAGERRAPVHLWQLCAQRVARSARDVMCGWGTGSGKQRGTVRARLRACMG